MYNLLIRNARIAHPDGTSFEGDVACEDARIARLDSNISSLAHETIEAAGKLLLPAVIDAQVHFRDPGSEYKEDLGTSSRAAVRGGVTSFLEMPNTAPPTTTQATLGEKLARAARNSVANYRFFIGATPDDLEALNSKPDVRHQDLHGQHRHPAAEPAAANSLKFKNGCTTDLPATIVNGLIAFDNGKIREQTRGRPLTCLA